MKKITKERQKRKMTQVDLSYTLKIHPSQLSKIESGRAKPYEPNEKKLEEFFNMSIEELLEEVE
jgi:ribosome-binding protein aMBF1 (putative translation factor)